MKIQDFAESKGLTKQAVYKAINRAGFSAKLLTDSRGSITKKGLQILSTLFPTDPESIEHSAPPEDPKQISMLKDQIKELELRCNEWENRYFALVDSHKEETDQLRKLIAREQELRYAAENKGFFRRLFAGKPKEGDQV